MSKTQLYRLIAGLLGVLGVALQILQDGWGMLLYYTVLSNILVFCFMFYLVYWEGKHGSINDDNKMLRLKGSITMAITITFMVYHFLLSPYIEHDNYWNVRNFLVHYIAPLALIFDTLLLDKKNSYRWYDPFSWTAIPLIYFVFALVNGQVLKLAVPGSPDSPYAYYFMNVHKFGWNQVLINSAFIFASYIVVGYVLLLLKKVIGKKN